MSLVCGGVWTRQCVWGDLRPQQAMHTDLDQQTRTRAVAIGMQQRLQLWPVAEKVVDLIGNVQQAVCTHHSCNRAFQ